MKPKRKSENRNFDGENFGKTKIKLTLKLEKWNRNANYKTCIKLKLKEPLQLQ